MPVFFPDYSRTRLQEWIRSKQVTVNGVAQSTRHKVRGGEEIIIELDVAAHDEWNAADIPLNIVYEDDAILVINKPIGLVVHPAAGHYTNTLANALLHYLPRLAELPRAGIVHRLDKDTIWIINPLRKP